MNINVTVEAALYSQCGSCGEPIYWLKHQRTGKAAPIEVKVTPAGNILTDVVRGTYCIANAAEKLSYPEWLHLNHFASCPQAKTWKRHGGSHE